MTTYVFVHHHIKDAETAFARGERLLAGTDAPAGTRVLQFCPSRDRSEVMCVWESDGVDALREYVDSTLGESSDNSYFEIDATVAMGLPHAAAA